MDAERRYVLILWGRDFEEVDAVVFASALRRAGLRVKVVGVGGSNQAGAHGVAIVPDLMLGQALALAESTKCVIVPCYPIHRKRLRDDPRYRALLQAATVGGALVVINDDTEGVSAEPCERSHPPFPQAKCIRYGKNSLTHLVDELAARLTRNDILAADSMHAESSSD